MTSASGRRDLERAVQSARLEAGDRVEVGELEDIAAKPLVQGPAVFLDRGDQADVVGVVDRHDHFEGRVFLRREAVEGGVQHRRVLVAGGDMDGHHRLADGDAGLLDQGGGTLPRQQPGRAAAKQGPRHLVKVGQRQHQQDAAERQTAGPHHQRTGSGVDAQRGEHGPGGHAGRAMGGDRPQQRLEHGGAAAEQGRHRQEHADQDRDDADSESFRLGLDSAAQLPLGLTVGVQHAPVRAGAAFDGGLPGLVERLDHVVLDAHALGVLSEFPDDPGLLGPRGVRVAEIVAVGRPADFTDPDRFAGIGLPDALDLVHRVGQGARAFQLFPVRQRVDADEVGHRDRLGRLQQFGPCVGRADRNPARHAGADLRHIGGQGLVGLVGAQQRLVADHDSDDVRRVARDGDGLIDLLPVMLRVGVQPDPQIDLQAHAAGDAGRAVLTVGNGIGPDAVGDAVDRGHVLADLGHGDMVIVFRAEIAAGRAVRYRLQTAWRCRHIDRRRLATPDAEMRHRRAGENRSHKGEGQEVPPGRSSRVHRRGAGGKDRHGRFFWG